MPIQVNDSGTWRKVKDVWVNQGGTWLREKVVYEDDGGTWRKVFAPDVVVDYLVIGGGGGGGGGRPDSVGGGGGGGGGGGVLASSTTVNPSSFSAAVTIGAGALECSSSANGNNGNPTVVSGSISAIAGGGYAGFGSQVGDAHGGGGGFPNGSGQVPYGTNGISNRIGAGGGAGGRDDGGGHLGGAGFVWPINKTTYSGGGGSGGEGGSEPTSMSGGAGGGGKGGNYSETGFPGTFYGGGGGGGGGNNGGSVSGAPGYSGTAIFSYVWPTQLFNGGVVTSTTTNGVTRWFHQFINNGTLTGV